MTRAAREFVGALTFEAVTGRPVHTEILVPGTHSITFDSRETQN